MFTRRSTFLFRTRTRQDGTALVQPCAGRMGSTLRRRRGPQHIRTPTSLQLDPSAPPCLARICRSRHRRITSRWGRGNTDQHSALLLTSQIEGGDRSAQVRTPESERPNRWGCRTSRTQSQRRVLQRRAQTYQAAPACSFGDQLFIRGKQSACGQGSVARNGIVRSTCRQQRCRGTATTAAAQLEQRSTQVQHSPGFVVVRHLPSQQHPPQSAS